MMKLKMKIKGVRNSKFGLGWSPYMNGQVILFLFFFYIALEKFVF